MEPIGALLRRLRVLLSRGRFDSELEEEMQAHLAMQVEENLDNGMDTEEANYAARRQFGNTTRLRETSGELWGWGWVERLGQDLRYALRVMRRSPGLTLAAIGSLALGIGADTALFSVMDALWFRPLAVRDPGAVVRVFSSDKQGGRGDMAYADYLDIATTSRTIESLAATQRRGPFLTVDGVAESTLSEIVSDNYFTVLGIQAWKGRVFHERAEGERVIVISHGYWTRRFGEDPRIVGRQVEMNGQPFEVIGVAPQGFRGIELWSDADLWMPMSAWSRSEQYDRETRMFTVFGRLRPGSALKQAKDEVASIARRLAAAYPGTNRDRDAIVLSAWQHQTSSAGASAVILGGIVMTILLIACVNVVNLLLARNEARRREISIRLALGCSRLRLVRQLMTESFLLTSTGAAAALFVAVWLIKALPFLLPMGDYHRYQLDLRVLSFTMVAATLSGLFIGLLPAMRASRLDVASDMKRSLAGGRLRWLSMRDGLVAGQMALSVVLLACAGLLLQSFLRSLSLDFGFARKDIAVVRLSPELPEPQARVFYQQLLERVRTLPGVKRAGLARRAPLWPSEGGMTMKVTIPDSAAVDSQKPVSIKFNTAGDNYFRTMGIPLMRGREFDGRDNAAGQPVAIINETMARRYWPKGDAIGRVIGTGPNVVRQIAGIVKDTKINSVLEPAEPYIYLPFEQDFYNSMSLVVETAGDPLAIADPIRSEIRALHRIPAPEIDTMESLIRTSTAWQESMAVVASILGLLGAFLAGAGLYGVMSYAVARRTQEIGLRMALGESRQRVVWGIFRRAVVLSGVGAVAGVIGALGLSEVLSSLVHGVSARDPVTLGAASLLLLLLALFASLLPAIRASQVDPMVALRYE